MRELIQEQECAFLMMIDCDRFKSINGTHGHARGNRKAYAEKNWKRA